MGPLPDLAWAVLCGSDTEGIRNMVVSVFGSYIRYVLVIVAMPVMLGAMRAYPQSGQGQMTGCPGCP